MREGEVKVINQLGLHARAAAQLIRVAVGFKSSIKLINLDISVEADAKSILSVLTLAASKGTMVQLLVEGLDEDLAFETIEKLFLNGFGELT